MAAFTTAIDIANRALGHLGLGGDKRITSFTEDSKQASETGFVYDKLREAELRRNVWTFAVRKAVLRAVSTTTQLVTFPAWAVGTTYGVNFIVSYNGLVWYSLSAGNVGHAPSDTSAYWTRYFGPKTADAWDSTVAYFAGELVSNSGAVYLSLVNSNSSTLATTASWLPITAATLADLNLIWPVGTGPVTQNSTRNVFVRPYGYLREAPQAPKTGSNSPFGAPGGLPYNDWEHDDDYIITDRTTPIVYRFVANIADVTRMDPLFCEGLGARIGIETCETITNSTDKINSVEQKYVKFMAEARLINGIEQGPTEPPEDDYITCRA